MEKSISILWSVKTINTLNNIVIYISSIKLKDSINELLNHYVDNYEGFKPYKLMGFNIKGKVSPKVLKLAHACEISIKKYRKRNTSMSNELIFKSISRIIYDVIDSTFKYNKWELNYQEEYLINLVSEVFNQPDREIIKSAYHISLKIIDIDIDENILEQTETFYMLASEVDLSFLTTQQCRNIMKILKISRKIYLRIFLVIVNYLCREESILTKKLIIDKSKNKTLSDFKNYTKDIMIEILIVLTSIKIDKNTMTI